MKKRTLLFKLVCLVLILLFSFGLVSCSEGQPNTDTSSDIPISSGVSTDSDLLASSDLSDSVDVVEDIDLSKFEPAIVTEVDTVDWDSSLIVGARIDYIGEDEVWSDPDLILFRGTVCSLKSLLIDFGPTYLNGRLLDNGLYYYAILSLRVDEVYKGDVTPGEEIKVLVSLIDRLGYFETDKVSYERMLADAEGIFGVHRLEERYANHGERIFDYSSVADCSASLYMMDGGDTVSFRFLHQVLTFSTLDEGETYVRQKLEQYAD